MDCNFFKQLIDEIKNDNESSFKIFFNYYFPRFLRIAHFYVNNNEVAEEIVMDVFAKLWKNRKKLQEVDNCNNYAYTLIKNQSLNYLKKNKISLESLNEYSSSKMIEYIEPEKLYLGKELVAELEKVVRILPPRCQLIYRMVREDELKYREVAEILNISKKAVENQLLIAMKRIRVVLERYMGNTPKRKLFKQVNMLFIITLFFI